MEKIKDPAMILALTANIGVFGSSAYFYKQLEAIRADLVKMSQTLTGVVRKIAEIEKGEQHKGEALHALNDQVRRINQAIDELPSFEIMNDMEDDLNEVVTVLQENDIQVDRPSQTPRRIRSGDRRDHPRRDSMDSIRQDQSGRRVVPRSTDRTRSVDRSRIDDTRTSNRHEPMRQPSSRADSRTEPPQSYDEDDRDLIDIIRRQQPRV